MDKKANEIQELLLGLSIDIQHLLVEKWNGTMNIKVHYIQMPTE